MRVDTTITYKDTTHEIGVYEHKDLKVCYRMCSLPVQCVLLL